MSLCGASLDDSPEVHQVHLKQNLALEYRFSYLVKFLQAPSLNDSQIKLEQAIPCIMHAENCTGKHIFKLNMLQALDLCASSVGEDFAFTNQVSAWLNWCMLGDHEAPYHWKLPFEDGVLGKITIHNWHMQKITDFLK